MMLCINIHKCALFNVIHIYALRHPKCLEIYCRPLEKSLLFAIFSGPQYCFMDIGNDSFY